jgi:hypothetical protein
MRKKIVKTLPGDELPPKQKTFISDSNDPFELTMESPGEYGSVQVYIETAPNKWQEIVTIYAQED